MRGIVSVVPCQGWGRGFESRFSLTKNSRITKVVWLFFLSTDLQKEITPADIIVS